MRSGSWRTTDRDGDTISRAIFSTQILRSPKVKWVTRKGPKVDRIACPWLIKRFVDPGAEFPYVPPEELMAVAEREKAIPRELAVYDALYAYCGSQLHSGR